MFKFLLERGIKRTYENLQEAILQVIVLCSTLCPESRHDSIDDVKSVLHLQFQNSICPNAWGTRDPRDTKVSGHSAPFPRRRSCKATCALSSACYALMIAPPLTAVGDSWHSTQSWMKERRWEAVGGRDEWCENMKLNSMMERQGSGSANLARSVTPGLC